MATNRAGRWSTTLGAGSSRGPTVSVPGVGPVGAALSIVLPEMPDDVESFRQLLKRFGVPDRFGTPEDLPIVRLKPGQAPPMPADTGRGWILQPAAQDLITMTQPPDGYVGFAYRPVEAARAVDDAFAEGLSTEEVVRLALKKMVSASA